MQSTTDDQLVQRLFARDASAMTVFYDTYGKILYNVIMRIVRQEEVAEDVLQESLLKIWSSFATFDINKGRLFTWALNVSRNTAIDQLRSRRAREAKRTQPLDKSAVAYLADATTFQPEHVGVAELVSQLKPKDSQILGLLYYGGRTQAEAAQELNLPLGTVKTRTRAALRALAKAGR